MIFYDIKNYKQIIYNLAFKQWNWLYLAKLLLVPKQCFNFVKLFKKKVNIYFNFTFQLGPTGYTSRMAGFFLYISNTTSKKDGYLCFHEIQNKTGTPLEDQSINCPVHGRYVIYYNERRPDVEYPVFYSKFAYIELCEVKVYGEYTTTRCFE